MCDMINIGSSPHLANQWFSLGRDIQVSLPPPPNFFNVINRQCFVDLFLVDRSPSIDHSQPRSLQAGQLPATTGWRRKFKRYTTHHCLTLSFGLPLCIDSTITQAKFSYALSWTSKVRFLRFILPLMILIYVCLFFSQLEDAAKIVSSKLFFFL